MTKINIYDSTYEILDKLSYNTGNDMADIVEDAILEYVENNGLRTEANSK